MTALLTGLVAGLTLAGCGVPPSGVIQAGPAASGIFPPGGAEPTTATVIPLYFVHDGALKPYPRKTVTPTDVQSVLDMLFAGPIGQESSSATTNLPRLAGAPELTIDGSRVLTVRLPEEAGHLGKLALMQLTCTLAAVAGPLVAKPVGSPSGGASAAVPSDNGQDSLARTKVRVSGSGWTTNLSGSSCPHLLPS